MSAAGKNVALKAVALDPSPAEAHLSLCRVVFAELIIPQALEECGHAIELNPNLGEAYHFRFRAEVLATLNRHREAIALERKASELNPFSRPWALPRALQWAREYDAAIQEANARLTSDPYDLGDWRVLTNVYRCKGMWKEEVRSLQRTEELSGDAASASVIARDFERGGYRAVVLGELERSKQKALTQYVSPVKLAGFTAQLAQGDETLTFLEQGFREHDWSVLFIQCDCAYDFLHSDERYRSLIKKIGLPSAF